MKPFLPPSGLLLAASLCLMPTARAQEAATGLEVGRPFLTNFAPTDYDASFQNWAIVQDGRGVMYVGNNSDVLEYDGATWRLIETPHRSGIRSLAKAPDGRIYVGAVGDLGYLAPDSLGRMQFVSLLEHVPEAHRDFTDVWGTDVIGGDVYFRTTLFLLRWDGQTMQAWQASGRGFHTASTVDGTLYIREWGRGLLRMEGDSLRLLPGGERFAEERVYVLLPFGDGRILVGTRDRGFFLFDPSVSLGEAAFTPFRTEADAQIRAAGLYQPGTVLPGGRFALNTISDGVFVIDRAGRLLQHLDREAGLRDEAVFYSYLDRDGGLWLALDNGLARVDLDAPLSYYGVEDGLESSVLSLERHGGRLYAGTTTGTYRLDASEGRFRRIAGTGFQAFDLLAAGGDLLMTSSNNGLLLLDGDRARIIQGAVAVTRLHRSKQDSARVFALTTGRGLFAVRQHAPGIWRAEGTVPGVEGDLWSVVEPEPGTLWLSTTNSGVWRVRFPRTTGSPPLDVAEVTAFGPEQGLPPGSGGVATAGGRLFAMAKSGLLRFDPETEHFVPDTTTFAGLQFDGPPQEWTMEEDETGRVWLVFGEKTALAYPQPGGTYRVETAPFRRFAGIRVYGVQPEADSVMWITGVDRLIRLDLGAARQQASAFPALVRRVATAQGRLLYAGAGAPVRAALPFTERSLRFEYAAPGFAGVGRTEYRVWLDGFEAHPAAWTRETAKEYTNLPPGAYTFRVVARDVNGSESAEATYGFQVRSPWWRTWWAYGFYALLLAGGVFVVDRTQRRRLLAKERERAREHELEQAREIERAYEQLKTTQAQLVQQEKLASLGALTAGIAHEIKNPLNFVNNFADLSAELVAEIREEVASNPDLRVADVADVLDDLETNARKVKEHGRRADGIVRSMLDHSRGGKGSREPVDLNALLDEYVNLAYHGMRAQRPGFNAQIDRAFDPTVEPLEVLPQEMGRVFINLLNNAFYAVHQKALARNGSYQPTVSVATQRKGEGVEIRVGDNGTGMPEAVRQKIFEPFFTTKPTGDGTGLGLSLSHEIVAQGHGGALSVESVAGEGTTFSIYLPGSSKPHQNASHESAHR